MVVRYVADGRGLKCPTGKVAAGGTEGHLLGHVAGRSIQMIAVTSAETGDITHETVTAIGVVGGTGMSLKFFHYKFFVKCFSRKCLCFFQFFL